MGELNGRIALVTGAARGLGAAIVDVFLREGARVVAADVLREDAEAALQRWGGNARFIELDVTSEAHWTRAAELAERELGPVDTLVNNAGLAGVYPFESTDRALWDRLVGVMQTGPYLGLREFIPRMQKLGGGSIVNVGSTNALGGMAQTAAYTSAKHGILGLTRALALEYARAGIRINTVCPGPMRTPMLERAFGEQMESFAAHVPIGRLADPHEVAELVCFAASSRASYCVGATFVADGGLTAS
jgi:3alpha(or 20beta)-hydroxysteroid dehydrogenase